MAKSVYSPGDIVGTYKVVGRLSSGKYLCECIKCGSESDVQTVNIRKNTMCRFCRTKFNAKPKVDLVGMRFGRLTVVDNIVKPNGRTAWMCLCDCGNTTTVSTCHLKSGHTNSCGCYMREQTSKANMNDLSGQRFGRLVAIKRGPGHLVPSGQVLTNYICKCDCGNEVAVLTCNLMSGNTQSCGCVGSSRGEAETEYLLRKNGIKFTREHSFRDLRTDKGGVPKFDFAIWDSASNLICVIEYNGEQHYYQHESYKWFGKLQRDETDELKRQYCEDSGIKLFVIRYDVDLYTQFDEVLSYIKTKV